ncbi:hypothetical protein ACFPA1_22615 [Neobacillus sp. GCM10023253]|uniref:hypothetical protein n=1 Tax=Neobacillus sp. GCM10023253 TaxID=3252644 RepID=UPI003606A747
MAEKAFLGSLMKAEYLLTDTVIQPEQLESARHEQEGLFFHLCLQPARGSWLSHSCRTF